MSRQLRWRLLFSPVKRLQYFDLRAAVLQNNHGELSTALPMGSVLPAFLHYFRFKQCDGTYFNSKRLGRWSTDKNKSNRRLMVTKRREHMFVIHLTTPAVNFTALLAGLVSCRLWPLAFHSRTNKHLRLLLLPYRFPMRYLCCGCGSLALLKMVRHITP